MSARRRTWWIPERLLLPPAPRDPAARAAWDGLNSGDRANLARCLSTGTLPENPEDRDLVRALANARVATAWRPRAGAVVLGWLVLMTVWGFGRAQYGGLAVPALAAGLAGGAVAAAVAWRQVQRRLRASRRLADPRH